MRIEILEEKRLNLVCSCQVCPVVTIVHSTTAKEMKGVTLAHRLGPGKDLINWPSLNILYSNQNMKVCSFMPYKDCFPPLCEALSLLAATKIRIKKPILFVLGDT